MYSYSGLINLKEICSFLCIKSVIKKKLMQNTLSNNLCGQTASS